MRVVIVGGGPAGLYFAGLLKSRQPDWHVSVWERSCRDRREGSGIVLSRRGMRGIFRHDSWLEEMLRDNAIRWNLVRCTVRNRAAGSVQSDYFSIARNVLLHRLADRCEALGVELVYDKKVGELHPYKMADLVVAADGVHSTVRHSLAEHLQTSERLGTNRYLWMEIARRLDAFTFQFVEDEGGVWCAHAYPHAPSASTMIIECTARTFQRSHIETATADQTRQYLRWLFSPMMGKAAWKSSVLRWQQFVDVSNYRWVYRNVALLGDAAHTTHYSIGRGTQLAWEDAGCLVRLLSTEPSCVEALGRYHEEREGRVRWMQQRGRRSMRWFEHMDEVRGLSGANFAERLFHRTVADWEKPMAPKTVAA